jgi:chemotaxis protein MotB
MKLAQAGIAAVLSAVLLVTVGCAQKEKQEIQALTAEKQDLMNQNRDLQAQLAAAKARETELLAQRDSKQAELDAMAGRLKEAETKTAKTAPAPAPAPGWERGPLGDMVTVGSDILFESGKATLTAAGKGHLDRIVADIRSHYADMPLRIYGHTDSDPIVKTKKLWQDNLDLSANRAMAVTRYLISRGVSAKLVESVAMGEYHPVANNSSKAQRAKNRRVEIVVIRKGG